MNSRPAKETHLQAVELARRLEAPDQLARATLGYGEPYVEGGLLKSDSPRGVWELTEEGWRVAKGSED